MSYIGDVWRALRGRGSEQLAIQRSPGSNGWLLGGHAFGNDSITISKTQALQVPAVTACIDVIAESIAMLPLRLYRKPTPEDAYEQQVHGQAKVLNKLWSQRWTRATGMRFVIQQTLKHGSGFIFVNRNRNNQAESLTPLPSQYVEVVRQNGVQWYDYRDPHDLRNITRIPAESMLDIVFQYGEDGFCRMSKLQQAQEVVSRYAMQARSARRFFKTGAPPHAIMFPAWGSADATSDEAQQQARINIVESVRRANDKGNPFIFLEHGTQIKQIGINPDDSQFVDVQLAMTNQIARVFSVPPVMIGDLSKGTYNNTQQSASFLLKHTLQPLMVSIQQQFDLKLFGNQSGEQSYVKFDDRQFLKTDMKSQSEVARSLVSAGVMSQNDARELVGLPRIEDESFDVPRQQAQMVDPGTPQGNGGENDGQDE